MRRKAWHAGEKKYGKEWKSGDRIGVALDMDGKSMTIFQNNKCWAASSQISNTPVVFILL